MFSLRNAISTQFRYMSSRSNAVTVTLNTSKSVDSQSVVPKRRNNEVGITEDGGQKFVGFTYYPRFPGQEDPTYEPTKVLMVKRIRPLKHNPFWDKNILASLGLTGKLSDIAIVANTPINCAKLWQVKHLVQITPVTLPQGLPEDGDVSGARLQDNGELRFIPKLKSDTKMAESQPKPLESPDFMDGQTLKKHLRIKWLKPWN
uniref:Large ribosomal subunit protein uL30m n=1 Tax=Simocephalus serrulatus TaxID=117539 RepID=A0A4Y7NMR4_9CRUS|nr:EOG090X0EYV [Simocephalus serrulatus]SVE94540.1 EOG090X0EYV [Simocephalus serrulatus]